MPVLEQRGVLPKLGRPPEGWMIHYEHPERIGEAFCGAPVVGVRGYFGRVECVVCAT